MITKIETDRDNKPRSVYHRAGTVDGRQDQKFAWTHPATRAAKEACSACLFGVIPDDVKGASA